MAAVKLTLVFECEAKASADANAIGLELENRLHQALETIIPNLRTSRHIQNGRMQFDMAVIGKRIKIRHDK